MFSISSSNPVEPTQAADIMFHIIEQWSISEQTRIRTCVTRAREFLRRITHPPTNHLHHHLLLHYNFLPRRCRHEFHENSTITIPISRTREIEGVVLDFTFRFLPLPTALEDIHEISDRTLHTTSTARSRLVSMTISNINTAGDLH